MTAKRTATGSTRLFAYVVPSEGQDRTALTTTLRSSLSTRLPDYMVPTAIALLDALPLTPSGKLDVRSLPEVGREQSTQQAGRSRVEVLIAEIWSELLEIADVDVRSTFFELGGDSILLVRAHQRLSEALGRDLPVQTLFRYPTVAALAQHLNNLNDELATPAQRVRQARSDSSGREQDEVAIIGMACRVPGASSVNELWANLRHGIESVVPLAEDDVIKLDGDQTRDPHFVPVGATIPDIDRFDAELFGYSAAEAAVIDPQQRLFLECAWEAFDDAGVETERYRVAVYAGSSLSTYLINNVLPAKLGGRTFLSHRHFNEATELRIEQGNARDHLPTRISFKLNLRGPSVNVQSTCSTALVAVHMARQALLNGECDVALAGAVSVITPQNTGYLWREGMMLSADGHCRAFDAQADGTVFGNGLGAVVLKRLSAAVADGDRIYAVVRGSAVNNDGAQKMDYSGPSVDAQADVIAEAHRTAGISADEVSYVEAHGTGTKLGDPVEIAGLTEAFGRTAPRRVGSCAIGSVKTNIGHLDEAAGVIGLIKTSLGLYHREIPPSLHFSEANPLSGLEESSFFVNTELREWPVGDGGRRIAGVSSFGMGGTNCHIVLEEPPIRAPAPPVGSDRPMHILPISGRSTDALRANIARYEQRLEDEPDGVLADICYSAATGRRHLDMRVAVLAGGVEQARSQLCAMLDDRDLRSASRVDGRSPRIGFLFTGQGSQYAGMGRGLYDTQPVFRAAIDRCDAILRPLIDGSLIEMLYGSESASCIDDTGNAQPALFAVGFALSRLWDSWGIRPSVVVGHSLGECVAACVAGVFDLEDALKLVAARGRLMQDLPRGGGMAQVNASAEVVAGYLAPYAAHVAIAAINTPDTTVISGRSDALRQVCDEIQRDGVDTIPLNVSHSFHSPLMEPMLEPFRAVANTIRYSEPRTDIVSNVTGAPVGPSELTTADYWVRHVIEPVKFDRAMQVAHDLGIRAFVELGPKPTLTNLARQCVSAPNVLWLPSMTPAEPHAALGSLQKLYLVGADVDWAGFDAPFARRRVPLPAYAFQRRRHWIEPPPRRPPDPIEPVAAVPADAWTPQAPGEHDPTPRCLAVTWEPVSVSDEATFPSRRCVMVGKGTVAERLAAHLSARGHQCVEVPAADSPSLRHAVGEPVGSEVVLVVEAGDVEDSAADAVRLLADTRLILEAVLASPEVGTLWIVTSEGDLGTATTERELGQSGAAALARTLTAEHPELRCVALSVPDSLQSRDLDIVADLVRRGAPDGEEQLAVHSASLYRPRLRPLATSGSASAHNLPIRSGGTYLITGGTGGLGLQLALAVARLTPRRLVLVSRRGETAVSDAATWAELAATGVEVETLCADVVDESRMRKIVEDCGPDLRGIFHLAGALEDGILLRQTAEQLPGIVGAKINGAWILHRLTQDRPLDFFVMFSSLASILGYRGQSSYGVANAFLDALARHRRRSGLPALSVSWGSWAGVGMTARMSEMHRARLEEEGERPMSPAAAIGALAAAMSSEAAHLVVADIDWRSFAAARGGAPAMIEALVEPIGQAGQHADPVAEMDFAARLREAPPEQARTILRDTVAAAVESLLGGVPGHEIDPTRGFEEMGLDSLAALDLQAKLQTELGIRLPATLAFEQPCLDALTQHLEERHFASAIEAAPTAKDATDGRGRQGVVSPAAAQVARDAQPGAPAPDRVAIIGVSCRFPKASSLDDFWELLIDGSDAVREIPPERWDVDALYDASPDAPGKMYVRNAALIDHVDCFDAAFFGISPREAASMDPRHRLLLEAAWSAVESAGIDPASLRGSDTAVYLGGDEFINDYLQQATDHLGSEPYMATGTTLSFTAGRLSYKLGLHGPSMVIATACSSSLVALHSAVQAIRQGECSTAVVGSAKLMLGPDETVQLCKLRALAPDGRSKVFSAEADGFGRGEGCAVVVLKRLDRALADGNPI
ncbi:MAG: acyltransferase domain-containing protein, partial [Actinomycetota bacterium]|nr:acyltransferase domain-containing protein [Actinomycetota bacterium]